MTNVPNILSAPVVMYDEGGNVLPDGTYGVTIHLKDSGGSVLYQEEQNVNVLNGVALITIGEGSEVGSNLSQPSTGLSYDLFQTSGDVTVELLVDGQTTPHTVAVLGSQPYAFISDYALQIAPDAVNSLNIADGSIVASDLDAGFLAELQSTIESNVAVTAANVSISATAGLSNSGSLTVEGVLKDLDRAIESLRDIDLAQSLANLTTSVQTQIDTVAANLASLVTTVNSVSSVASTAITNAATAQNTANTAVEDAKAAQDKADAAFEMATDTMNDISTNTDPSYNSVVVTGAAPSTPVANTLYKNNMIFAWANITLDAGHDPSIANDFNTYSVTEPVKHEYHINFKTPATSTSYLPFVMVQNSRENPNGISYVIQKELGYFVVHVEDTDADTNTVNNHNFDILVIGY